MPMPMRWLRCGTESTGARLLAKQGHGDEARTMLANIYGCFSEGFDTVERAKAPLDPPNA